MTRNQITAFLALAVLYWIGLLALRGVALSWEMLLPFSGVVAVVSLTLLGFDLWAWKLKIFRGWLIKRPILTGVWQAELKSDWIDPETGTKRPPIPCFMVVRQTASTLSFRLITPESRSETVSAAIEECHDGTFEISCAYRNRPRAEFRHRSEVHYGAFLLTAEGLTPSRLEGDYWTDRKTSGTMSLAGRRHGACISYDECSALFAPAG